MFNVSKCTFSSKLCPSNSIKSFVYTPRHSAGYSLVRYFYNTNAQSSIVYNILNDSVLYSSDRPIPNAFCISKCLFATPKCPVYRWGSPGYSDIRKKLPIYSSPAPSAILTASLATVKTCCYALEKKLSSRDVPVVLRKCFYSSVAVFQSCQYRLPFEFEIYEIHAATESRACISDGNWWIVT